MLRNLLWPLPSESYKNRERNKQQKQKSRNNGLLTCMDNNGLKQGEICVCCSRQKKKPVILVNVGLRIHNANYWDFLCSGMNGNSKGKSSQVKRRLLIRNINSSQMTKTFLAVYVAAICVMTNRRQQHVSNTKCH